MDNLLGVLLGAGVAALAGLIGLMISKSTEHAQWLRNEKRKEYIAADLLLADFLDSIGRLIDGKPKLNVHSDQPRNADFAHPINMLAPSSVKTKVVATQDAIRACIDILQGPNAELRKEEAKAAHAAAEMRQAELLRAMRRDLGIRN
jgi:hypothetical protein